MAYGPGRSRLWQGVLVGTVVWLVGCLTVAVLFVGAGIVPATEIGSLVLAYPAMVVWFVIVLVFPSAGIAPVVAAGATTTALAMLGGAAAVTRATPSGSACDVLKVGGSIAVGHALLTVAAFAAFQASAYDGQPSLRTFVLAFGGFVVPAAFGAVGGVVQWQFGGE